MKSQRVFSTIFMLMALALSVFTPSVPAQAATVGCTSSSPTSGLYTVTICITSPANNSTFTGNGTVTATASFVGTNPGVQRMVFNLGSSYLLTDYSSPYTFSLPSNKWADGSYTLFASALLRDGFTTAKAQITVHFSNGNATTPVNTGTFTATSGRAAAPGQPFIVAASGDGASGETNSTNVVNLVKSLNPNLFLYLGDVYESGSKAEFYNWYGTSLTNFGQLRAITDPTIGNHEYGNSIAGSGYFDYWNNIPNYYSFNAGGWHFISLNSNSSKINVTTTGAEYAWLQQDLAANVQPCTIVYYHQPLFNIGPEGATTAMASIWSLMAQFNVKIVLNGHDHDYQRWKPLNGSGQLSSTGISEFVAGGAGHGLQTITTTDTRVAYSNSLNPTAFGVLLLSLSSSGATFSYRSTNGTVLDSGSIACGSVSTTPTATPRASATFTPTATSTTVVATNTPTATFTPTATSTTSAATDTPTATFTTTATATTNPAATATFTATPTATTAPAATNTPTPTATATPTATNTPTATVTTAPPATNTPTPTATTAPPATNTPTPTATNTAVATATSTPTATATFTATPTTSGGSSLTFTPVADTYVDSSAPTTNNGSKTTLRTDASPIVNSYLRFNVSGVSGTVTRVRLLIFANSSLSAGITAQSVADNSWSELSMTYNSAPAMGGALVTSSSIATGTWVTLTVTGYISADGTYSFGITDPSATAISLASREAGANAPQLVIDTQ